MTKQHRDVVNFLINDPNAPTVEYRYRPGPQVRDSTEYVFARLQAEAALTGLPPEQFISRRGTYWGAVESIHPFRDGNTRTETVFFHSLCRNAGYDLGAARLYDLLPHVIPEGVGCCQDRW